VVAQRGDILAVCLDKGHGDQVGQRGQLLLPVGDECAELVQRVVLRRGQDARGRILPSRETLTDGHEVRIQTILPEEEQLGRPDARLDFINDDGHVVGPAQVVGRMQEFGQQANAPVVHQDDFVEETCHLVGSPVPLFQRGTEVGAIVHSHSLEAVQAMLHHACGQLGPHASQYLGEHGGAMIVGLGAALPVSNDQEDRPPTGVLGFRIGIIQAIEAREHHLQRRLDCQAASFQVDHPV